MIYKARKDSGLVNIYLRRLTKWEYLYKPDNPTARFATKQGGIPEISPPEDGIILDRSWVSNHFKEVKILND